MKKISALAALAIVGLALATPAHADDNNNVSGPIVLTPHQNPFGADLCSGALALVPWAAPWAGTALNDACNNREHVDHVRD